MKNLCLLTLTSILPLSLVANTPEPSSALEYQQTTNTRIVVEENFLRFFTGGSERMTIDAEGNVGIGTSSPINPLSIKSNNIGQDLLNAFNSYGNEILELGTLSDNETYLLINDKDGNPGFEYRSDWDLFFVFGKVGIGTSNPSANFEIKANAISGTEEIQKITISDAPGDFLEIGNATGSNGQFMPSIRGQHITDNRAALYLSGRIEPANDVGNQPVMVFDSRRTNGPISTRILFAWDSYGQRKMSLSADGSLHVYGNVTWPDYVFEDSYELDELDQVEKYIKKNHHLPEIPSASEVKENGIDIVDMQAKLLQKIEELTLYVIEQQKQLMEYQNKVDRLEKQISNKNN